MHKNLGKNIEQNKGMNTKFRRIVASRVGGLQRDQAGVLGGLQRFG